MGKKRASPHLQKELITQEKTTAHKTEKVYEEKALSEKKKPGHEIDEIFSATKKRKKPVEIKNGEAEEDLSKKQKSKTKKRKKKVSYEENAFVDPPSRPRRRTQDGLIIYSTEELGIGKSDAGGTPLCPFDCECCF